jgi:hypothetical protein
MKILALLARLYRLLFPPRFVMLATAVPEPGPVEFAKLTAMANPTGQAVTVSSEQSLDRLQKRCLDLARQRVPRAVRRHQGALKERTLYVETLPPRDRLTSTKNSHE